jgi:hypothetical protein
MVLLILMCRLQLLDCNETAYNGTFTVAQVLDAYRFQYYANATPTVTPASGQYTLSINSWFGGSSRIGMFDFQNGLFWNLMDRIYLQ